MVTIQATFDPTNTQANLSLFKMYHTFPTHAQLMQGLVWEIHGPPSFVCVKTYKTVHGFAVQIQTAYYTAAYSLAEYNADLFDEMLAQVLKSAGHIA